MLTECWHSGPLREGQFCTACESADEQLECAYCSAPSTVTSNIGPRGYDEPTGYLGQTQCIAPRPESRCAECHAGFARNHKREQRLAQEGWI